MIKCPVNRGRFKGHLITNTPQSMRLRCNNMIAEGLNNALTLLFSEISLLNWLSDGIFSLNVPHECIDEGRLELNILIPVVGGNTSVNVPVETKENEAIMLLQYKTYI